MGAALTYDARDQTREGTQAAPPLLNEVIGNPLLRGAGSDYTTNGQTAIATGGTDRPNS